MNDGSANPSGSTPAELKYEFAGLAWTAEVVKARERDFRAHMPDSIQHQTLCRWLDQHAPGWRSQEDNIDETQSGSQDAPNGWDEVATAFATAIQLEEAFRTAPLSAAE